MTPDDSIDIQTHFGATLGASGSHRVGVAPKMSLTDIKVKSIKPNTKIVRYYDEKGLYLEVAPSGGKWWRFKYRFESKEKRLSLGTYPDVGLKEAREKRDNARKLVAADVDPSTNRKAIKNSISVRTANSFEVISREWLKKYANRWTKSHYTKLLRRFEHNIFPWLGSKPITEMTAQDLLTTLRRIEERGALETAHRVLSTCGLVFQYAIATGRATYDPSRDLKRALPPAKHTHLASITDPQKVSRLLQAIDNYDGTFSVRCALKLAPLVFVRPGELRTMKWVDVDFENAEWRFSVTKTKTEHIVPLATQAIKILKDLYPLTGFGCFVFPSSRSSVRPMSENAVLFALRSLGYSREEMTGHGFRAMARTILDEVLKFRPDYIEHQLAHAVRDPNGRAYNRTAHLEERKQMMQKWADYLDELRGMQQ